MTDWNPPEPDDAPPAADPPPSSVPLRFGDGGAASDSMPEPPPPASGESTSTESTIPIRYHDAGDAPAETVSETETTLPEAPTPEPTSWLHPDPVEPVGVEALPAEDEAPSLAGNAEYEPATALHEEPPLEDEEIDVPESDDVEEVISEADEDDDEIVFDLSTLSVEERRHLSMRLTGAGISHIWEVGSDLVVSVEDAPAIERYVEEVRNPQGFGDDELASFDEESDVDDEEVYSAMSNLYVAADKLMQKPADEATAGEFYAAVDDVDGLPAPFGFDPRVWAQVQELANKVADTLDAEGDPNTVGEDARTLRHILANYV